MLMTATKAVIAVGSKAVEFVPVLGPALEYSKKAAKVTEMSNPVSATSRGIGIMFHYCFGKMGATSAECILWLSFSVIGGVTYNPVLIAAGSQFGCMVMEEFID